MYEVEVAIPFVVDSTLSVWMINWKEAFVKAGLNRASEAVSEIGTVMMFSLAGSKVGVVMIVKSLRYPAPTVREARSLSKIDR